MCVSNGTVLDGSFPQRCRGRTPGRPENRVYGAPKTAPPTSKIQISKTKFIHTNYNLSVTTHKKDIPKIRNIFLIKYYLLFIAACAAASLAIGTLNGEQDT